MSKTELNSASYNLQSEITAELLNEIKIDKVINVKNVTAEELKLKQMYYEKARNDALNTLKYAIETYLDKEMDVLSLLPLNNTEMYSNMRDIIEGREQTARDSATKLIKDLIEGWEVLNPIRRI